VFLLFDNNSPESTESLLEKHPKAIVAESLNNILLELRNLGLIQKENESYFVAKDIIVSEQSFAEFVTEKFKNYTPYLHLKRANLNRINKSDIILVLKNIFKQDFQDNTWDIYAKSLINWFQFSDLEIKNKFYKQAQGKRDRELKKTKEQFDNFIPRSSLKEILEIIPLVINDAPISSKFYKDLFMIGIIDEHKRLTNFGLELLTSDEDGWKNILRIKVIELPKMKAIEASLNGNPKITAAKMVKQLDNDFFDGNEDSTKTIYAARALTWLRYS
jgi:hypothetical protein